MKTKSPKEEFTAFDRRVLRVEREIREVVSRHLLMSVSAELPGFVTVTRVEVTRDLRSAKVFITMMGLQVEVDEAANAAAVKLLNSRRNEFQEEIARTLRMRYCPKLTFHFDSGYARVMKVENTIRRLEAERVQTP